MSITYLDEARVTGVRATEHVPRGDQNAHGYGNRIGTPWLLQLDGKRWHRVYVVCWSNAGSAYVRTRGSHQYLGAFDPRDWKAAS